MIRERDDMPLIQWNDRLQMQIREIDLQHQKLVTMVNGLGEAMRQGKGKEVLSQILAGLTAYTKTHFSTEEKYFAQFSYPQSAEHRQEHAAFVQKVSQFISDFGTGRVGVTSQVLNFLSDWLVQHIQGSDRQYAPLFKQNGLA